MKIETKKIPEMNKYRSFLFPAVVVLLIIVSFVAILKPKFNEVNKARNNLGKQKQELAKLSQKVAVLEGYDENELETRANQMLTVLPAEKNAPLIMGITRRLVNDYNLELVSLQIEVGAISTESATPTAKKETLPSQQIQLSVSGELKDLYDFLEAVETIAPLMIIESLNFTREAGSAEGSLNLYTYYLSEPKDIGKPNREIVLITDEEEEIYHQLSDFETVTTGLELPYVTSGKDNPFTY